MKYTGVITSYSGNLGLVRCEDENHEFPVELLLEAGVVGDRQVCVGQEIAFEVGEDGRGWFINEFEIIES